ncbi:hypothetical protein GCM10023219_20640 [Stakelama sediminis]|uniref:ImuA family protein n=1 Tax=Stakelama sediminis TaxID=463200 RepID=UPI0031ED6D86
MIDQWLNGGLRRDGVHEFFTVMDADKSAATAFAFLLSARACPDTPLFWQRIADSKREERVSAPGLIDLGLNPDRIILIELNTLEALLKAAVDSVRHGGLGAAILEIDGRAPGYDLTASRRLALAAERSGTMVMIVRSRARPSSSAAHSRWQVASAPSVPLAANAPGQTAFDLTLLRQRGGREGLHLQLEWDREHTRFRTPLSGGISTVSAGRAADRSASRAA